MSLLTNVALRLQGATCQVLEESEEDAFVFCRRRQCMLTVMPARRGLDSFSALIDCSKMSKRFDSWLIYTAPAGWIATLPWMASFAVGGRRIWIRR